MYFLKNKIYCASVTYGLNIAACDVTPSTGSCEENWRDVILSGLPPKTGTVLLKLPAALMRQHKHAGQQYKKLHGCTSQMHRDRHLWNNLISAFWYFIMRHGNMIGKKRKLWERGKKRTILWHSCHPLNSTGLRDIPAQHVSSFDMLQSYFPVCWKENNFICKC